MAILLYSETVGRPHHTNASFKYSCINFNSGFTHLQCTSAKVRLELILHLSIFFDALMMIDALTLTTFDKEIDSSVINVQMVVHLIQGCSVCLSDVKF